MAHECERFIWNRLLWVGNKHLGPTDGGIWLAQILSTSQVCYVELVISDSKLGNTELSGRRKEQQDEARDYMELDCLTLQRLNQKK